MELTLFRKGITHTILYDSCDDNIVKRYKWFVRADMYVVANDTVNGIRVKVAMHRLFLLESRKDVLVDHINRNPLDNRRCNLRRCTRGQNNKNRKSFGASKYLGVTVCTGPPRKDGTKKVMFCAKISVNCKVINLGYFESESLAARAYDDAAKIHHGEFANLNFK